ncbi:hypothetical protein [Carboxylicivirga linearis]|uniref:Uncharacterized protein n=1 Tax=Carboxylicivirga linearis TaxID=1628157 RepID=A0ABS5JTS5_9BACT|nr:hypothetical protein [Carboxylicivirga linearis]MBS2098195.1 hypothetical protein [Carboxylicivirga linearis]
MNETEIRELIESRIFILLRKDDEQLPSKNEDAIRRRLLKKIIDAFPYIIQKEKRVSNDFKLSKWNSLLKGGDYSFRKGIEGNVQWEDYSLNIVSLFLAMIRIQPSISFTELLNIFCTEKEQESSNEYGLNWNKLIDYLEEANLPTFYTLVDQPMLNIIDLVDKFYDEIKITHIHPVAYQQLFYWFGEATVGIGYNAFDEFNRNRNSKTAWASAIEEHLKIYGLNEEIFNVFLNNTLYPLLQFT